MTERMLDRKARKRIKRFIADGHAHRVKQQEDLYVYVPQHHNGGMNMRYVKTKMGRLRRIK